MKDYFKYCNAFVILTREGVVLTSDDTRITPEEDRYLQNLNRRLSERKYKRGKGSMTLDIKALREGLPWKNGRMEIPKRNESFLYARRMSSFLRFLL